MQQIIIGAWRAGDRIPSESECMALFGASRMTAHHTLRDLMRRGFLTRRKGAGSFVAKPRPYVSQYEHLDVIAEIEASGAGYRARIARKVLRPSRALEAERFGLREGEALLHAIVAYCADGVAVLLGRDRGRASYPVFTGRV